MATSARSQFQQSGLALGAPTFQLPRALFFVLFCFVLSLRSVVHNLSYKNAPGLDVSASSSLPHLFITGLKAVVLVSCSVRHVSLSSEASDSDFAPLQNPSMLEYWQESERAWYEEQWICRPL